MLGIGFAAIVVLLLARVAVTAWRQACASGRRHAAPIGSAAPAAGPAPPSAARRAPRRWPGRRSQAVTGVRLRARPRARQEQRPGAQRAARPRGRGRRVAVAVTFGANLLRLVDTPGCTGRPGTSRGTGSSARSPPQAVRPDHRARAADHRRDLRRARHRLDRAARAGPRGPASVIPAIGLARGTGPLMSPTVLDGRPPRTAGEIVLGTSVLRQFGLRVGQHVTVDTPVGTRAMLITGSAVFPYFGQGSFTSTDVGEGAETIASVLAPQAGRVQRRPGGLQLRADLLRARAPRSRRASRRSSAAGRSFCASIQQSTCLVTEPAAQHGEQLRRHRRHPRRAGGGARGRSASACSPSSPSPRPAAGAATTPYSRSSACAARDLRAVALWQASTVTVAALVIGIPLGVAAGRWAWQLVRGPGWPVRRRGHPAPGAVADPGDARGRPPRRVSRPARSVGTNARVRHAAAPSNSRPRRGHSPRGREELACAPKPGSQPGLGPGAVQPHVERARQAARRRAGQRGARPGPGRPAPAISRPSS